MAVEKRRRAPRPHCMPPAPLRRLGDGSRPVGWEVIQSLDGDLGLVLWNALRSIYEWAKPTADKNEPLRLFGAPSDASRAQLLSACAEAPQIASALQNIALLRATGGAVEPAVIGRACAHISEWAEERSLLDVAGHFAEAAAYADPINPAHANLAGRLCRRMALFDRSAAWFKRGRYAALRTKNRPERIRALLGFGSLMRSLGHYEPAEAYYLLAANFAERTRRRKRAAEAHHDLLSIAILTNDLPAAEQHVWEALRLYPANHPFLPVLGHDWAFALILQRYYSHAVPLVELALSRVALPELRSIMFSTLARAAAGSGRSDLHKRAEEQALGYVARFSEYAAPVLINLGQAAWLLEDWQRAEDFARRGVVAAHAQPDERYQRDASDLLKRLRRRDDPPLEILAPLPDVVDAVRSRYAARLREAPPPRKKREEGHSST